MRLVLHIGATKTGTSAIQNGLARNRDLLKTSGVLFPVGRRDNKAQAGHATGGNGDIFRRFRLTYEYGPAQAVARFEADLRHVIEGSSAATVLFSNEALGGLDYDMLASLQKVFARHITQVRIIYYVRHIADHAVSQYGEYVKRRWRKRKSFEQFAARKYRAPFKGTIATYESVFDKIDCVLYDDVRKNLYRDFLARLGLSPEGHAEATTVNRSLTDNELTAVWSMNETGIDRALILDIVSDYAMRSGSPKQSEVPLSYAAIAALGASHSDMIDYVNARLGDGKLRIASDALMERVQAKVDNEQAEGVDPEVALGLLQSVPHVLGEEALAGDEPARMAAVRERFDTILARARKLAVECGSPAEAHGILQSGVLLAQEWDTRRSHRR